MLTLLPCLPVKLPAGAPEASALPERLETLKAG